MLFLNCKKREKRNFFSSSCAKVSLIKLFYVKKNHLYHSEKESYKLKIISTDLYKKKYTRIRKPDLFNLMEHILKIKRQP